MDSIRNFLEEITAFHVDWILLATGIVIFLIGIVLPYKKGPWLGLSISLSGILLVVVAALSKLF